ncbi:DivIVA domain-containing protein [Mycobacterium sp. 852002-50816_SCH5313054-b]|uniref:DivIVA domain-containing protein n=1 Tax=Mycobacterium sp. 852002-50816_SCH5313054-b TaxID=1834092 RepID=UPI0026F41447|nr:DivIVA domain-containing protein [Mycobacterium sp. 852002-50816_SCH5313054-b]
MRDPAGRALTADQVRTVTFSKPPVGKRGYNEDEVDAFLEAVAAQFHSGPGVPPAGRSHARDPALDSKGRRFLNGVLDMVRWIGD